MRTNFLNYQKMDSIQLPVYPACEANMGIPGDMRYSTNG